MLLLGLLTQKKELNHYCVNKWFSSRKERENRKITALIGNWQKIEYHKIDVLVSEELPDEEVFVAEASYSYWVIFFAKKKRIRER